MSTVVLNYLIVISYKNFIVFPIMIMDRSPRVKGTRDSLVLRLVVIRESMKRI